MKLLNDQWSKKIKELKLKEDKQEIIIKRREGDHQKLISLAKELGLHSHIYKVQAGRFLVVSNAPLRPDLFGEEYTNPTNEDLEISSSTQHRDESKSDWIRKIEKLKCQEVEQEIVMRRESLGKIKKVHFIENTARALGLYFHAYEFSHSKYSWKKKKEVFVVSTVPLPNYRADLDKRHGSTQREIQISMDTEHRVESILASAREGCAQKSVHSEASQIHSSLLHFPEVPQTYDEKLTLSLEMCRRQWQQKFTPSATEMQHLRERLPSYKMKDQLLTAVANNQVVIVSGETGCGKTTQIPQFILEDEIELLRGVKCNIVCTQPRRISAISVAARVAFERGENLGETVGYQIRLEEKKSPRTRLLFCTSGVLLRWLVHRPNIDAVTHVLVDEIHERGMNEDFLLIILRDLLSKRPELRIILMSATINAELFSKYFGDAPIIYIPGFTFPVKQLFLEDVLETIRYTIPKKKKMKADDLSELFEDIDVRSEYRRYSLATQSSLEAWDGAEIDLRLVEATIEYICRSEGEGAILVFLTGWIEISDMITRLRENPLLSNSDMFMLLPLHGSMPTIHQQDIFQQAPWGKRKIIIATNIAETSITIDDVVFVVDCGKAKESSYDAVNKLSSLSSSWISKASAHQRKGRAGRVRPGVCYHLYPRIIYDAMPQFQLPEILRTPLEGLCLQIKSLQFENVANFLAKALQPPNPLSVHNAIDLLKTIGALNDMEDLTSLGRHLSTLPVDPKVGKMLLMGVVFQCLSPALVIASMVDHRSPFILPIDDKYEADKAKKRFAGDSNSDHIALLRAFEGWQLAKRDGLESEFCCQNFLSLTALQTIEKMQTQFFDLLADIGFINKTLSIQEYNRYSADIEMISAVLCAGLYPCVAQCKPAGTFTKEDGKISINPSSVNSHIRVFPRPYLIYSNKLKTSTILIGDSTNISDYALLMFGGTLTPSQNGQGIEMLGGYLHFSSSERTLKIVQNLRAALDRLLQRKIDEPALDMHAEGEGVVPAVIQLLHSENRCENANSRDP
ncbi:DExH-box ATP-dependent RNA helicase DExH1 isoform X2 [Cryptomeria japonica]|nr:DExH-box ATP-dependent RNA helicase DExH1 isoform X2 [Cryptomeria japonica]